MGPGHLAPRPWSRRRTGRALSEGGEHVVAHLALHLLDLGSLLGVLLDERADAVLPEADVSALVGDGARQGLGELRFMPAEVAWSSSNTVKAIPSRTMFWPTTPATKSPASTFSTAPARELHQVRVGEVVDRRLEVVLLHPEVVDAG